QRAFQMSAVQDQKPIQALCSGGSDEPLCDSIRLWHLNQRPHDSNALRLEDGIEAAAELAVPIPYEKANAFCPVGDGLGHLPRPLCDPAGVGVSRASRQMDATAGDLDENSTYTRWSQTVSTVKKATAMVLFACARLKSRQDGCASPISCP